MNVNEITPGTNGTISHYFALALPLTIPTAWIIIAFQSKYIFPAGTGFWKRLTWPFFLFHNMKNAPAETLEYPESNFIWPFVAMYIFYYLYWVGYILTYTMGT
jgi:hypothetical protein